jgi:uncharacterized membrane-anchored protein YjiN (DUF445 family)
MSAEAASGRSWPARPDADLENRALKAKTMNAPDKTRHLRQMKLFNTGLLVAATLLFLVARLQPAGGVWSWVAAFAEAAMIGALADWFAVVALFRHPLGLPIPHTAIIPRNKARIADNLAVFIRDKFLATETLVAKLRGFDPAHKLAAWLSQRENADLLAGRLVDIFINGLDFIDDIRVQAVLRETLHQRLQQADLGKAIGQLLAMLTQGQRHQALLNSMLARLAALLDDPETQQSLANVIIEISGREYPNLLKMVGMVADTEEFSLKIAHSLVGSINRWLHDISDDPNHPRRQQFDSVVDDFLANMQHDPAYRQKIEQWKQQLLAAPVVADYLGGLWLQLKDWLRQDLRNDDSRLRQKLTAGASHLGQWLSANPPVRDSINDHIAGAARGWALELRETISSHIASTVRQWENSELVRELELSVGSDLQFIRVNGTLVGGLIGILLHALALVLPVV